MNRSRVVLVAACTALPLLGGCTAELASHAAKKVLNKSSRAQDQGVYKVGTPYRINGRLYRPAVDYNYVETGIASWYGSDFHRKRTANGELFDMNRVSAAHRTLPLPSMVRVTNLENGRALNVRVSDRGPFAKDRIIDLSRKAAQLLGFYDKGTARVRVEVLAEESRALAREAQRKGLIGDDPVTLASLGGETAIGFSGNDSLVASSAAARPVQGTSNLWRNPDLRPAPGAIGIDRVTVEDLPPISPGRVNPPDRVKKPDRVVSIQPERNSADLSVGKTKLFIQAGAFSSYANASRLRSKLDGLAPTAINPLDRGKQRLYRVRLGPLESLSEADRILASLASKGHANATIVVEEATVRCGANVSSTLTKC